MKTVVISGPESTGKSTLAEALSEHYQASLVIEVARQYLQTPGPSSSTYLPSDLKAIAAQQIAAEASAYDEDCGLTIADTDLQVIRIWWKYRYGPLPSWLIEQSTDQLAGNRSDRLYLMSTPDLPWQPDPLRENPDDRDLLFSWFMQDAEAWHLQAATLDGSGQARVEQAIQLVDRFVKAAA